MGSRQQELIYGADDRIEAAGSAPVGSMVALIPRDSAFFAADAGPAVSFGRVHATCDDERFAEQPAAAECTGILLTPQLMITAGHCMEVVTSCRDYRYIRNYVAGDAGGTPAREFVELDCKSTLISINTSFIDERDLDFAVVELENAAAPFSSLKLRRDLPKVGETVTSIGTSAGLPFKATTGSVLAVRSAARDYFDFTGDLYAGGSGSGVFDQDGALLGIHVRGGADFENTPAGCRRSRTVAEDGGAGSEQANTLSSILKALCELRPELDPCPIPAGEPAPGDSSPPSLIDVSGDEVPQPVTPKPERREPSTPPSSAPTPKPVSGPDDAISTGNAQASDGGAPGHGCSMALDEGRAPRCVNLLFAGTLALLTALRFRRRGLVRDAFL